MTAPQTDFDPIDTAETDRPMGRPAGRRVPGLTGIAVAVAALLALVVASYVLDIGGSDDAAPVAPAADTGQ